MALFDKFIISFDENSDMVSATHPNPEELGFSGSFADRATKLAEQIIAEYPGADVQYVTGYEADNFKVECQLEEGKIRKIWEKSDQHKFDEVNYTEMGMTSKRVLYQTIENGSMMVSIKKWVELQNAE